VSLTAADVAEILKLIEESTFDELNLEIDGIKLTLRRGGGVESSGAPAFATASTQPVTPAPASPAPAAPTKVAVLDPNVKEVPAPLLGTFYRAPKPGAPPFVEVGAVVEEDTVVGIIEVMKLMNTVRAGVRGTVTEILVRDGELVEYGESLLRVRKAG
jgi:acetyl-CoA carboxylase biotin carboxyl carrier protein